MHKVFFSYILALVFWKRQGNVAYFWTGATHKMTYLFLSKHLGMKVHVSVCLTA